MRNMKGTGRKISSMDRELKLGVSLEDLKLHILGISSKGRKMGREGSTGKMEATSKGTLPMGTFQVLADITLLIWTSTTKGSLD